MFTPDERRKFHVVHLTSAHARNDIRIFRKQCRSLARAGFRVSLVVADGRGDETTSEGVAVHDVGRSSGRLDRILNASRRVIGHAHKLDADLYQFHDPELLIGAMSLQRGRAKVIFDSHEDVPKQMLGKPYLTPTLLRVLAFATAQVERFTSRRLDAVIGATPAITEKFEAISKRARNINNYPELGELATAAGDRVPRRKICYVGGIAAIRGILPLVDALGRTKSETRLALAGPFSEADTREAAQQLAGWGRVDELGVVDRKGVRDLLAQSFAGIVTFAPLPNHVDAQPNKMFEYMSAGVPVIASDFPLWREIVLGHHCGLCVDPLDADAIAEAIDKLAGDPDLVARLGENGQQAVQKIFNWSSEERNLINLYDEILA